MFERAGHEVFIDTGMTVGTDWVTEIGRRIAWCDALVVLFSAASVDSEMERQMRGVRPAGRNPPVSAAWPKVEAVGRGRSGGDG